MMTCENFQARFQAASEDPAILEHIRSCDRCLDFAAQIDPDVMFRALGGAGIAPPGGVDAFVAGVMQQVRVRGAETRMSSRRRNIGWTRRLAIAATIAAGMTGAMLFNRANSVATRPTAGTAHVFKTHASQAALMARPIIESYESNNATIVEVPTDSADVKVVMIIDENLPADL
jgi:hypothetical protein